MKRTFKHIIAALALIFASATAFAEAKEVKPGIWLDKTLTYNEESDNYTIRLESYVTGKVEAKSAPLDIALVLDVTTSMAASGGSKELLPDFVELCKGNEINLLYASTSTSGNNNYKRTDTKTGKSGTLRYRIKIGTTMYNLAYIRKYIGNNYVTDWFYGTGTNTGSGIWTRYDDPSANDIIYTDVKIDILMKNVKQFINNIHQHSLQLEDDETHCISIIPFAGKDPEWTGSLNFNDYVDKSTDMLEVNNTTNLNTLLTKAGALLNDMQSGTFPHMGFRTADAKFDYNNGRQKVVVFFTDGNANDQPNAVQGAYDSIKSKGTPLYAVGLYQNPNETSSLNVNGATRDVTFSEFTSWISSNYLEAQYTNSRYVPGDENPSDTNYSFAVSDGASLEAIFSAISEEISGLVDMHGTSTAVVDVVSKDFELPERFVASSVRCSVETCVGPNQWVKAGETGYDFNNAYNGLLSNLSVGVKGSQIDVHGFDFSLVDDWEDDENGAGNFVAEREAHTNAKGNHWFGNKLVIEFEVELKEDHSAGYELPSNDLMSGIYEYRSDQTYDIDDQIAPYPRPTEDFPAICIVKEGLNPGESAIFKVNGGGKSFRVILTQKEDNVPCFVVIRDLTDNNDYTVEETFWTYAYDLTKTNGTTAETAARKVTKKLEKPTHEGMTGDEFKNEIKSRQHTDSPAYSDKYYVANDAVNLLFRFVNAPNTKPLHGEDAQLNQFGIQTIDPGHKEPGEDIE